MKKALKITGYILLSIIILLLIVVLSLQTRWAKNAIRDKVETYVQHKTNTTFEIGSIDFSFPKWIEIDGIFLLDKANDTLLFGKHLKIDVDMIALIQSKYVINKVVIDQFYVNLYNKEADSTYNYQFMLDAFKSKETVVKESDTTKVLNFKIKDIDVTQARFKQKDYYLGNFMDLNVQKFHLNVDSINIKDLHVDINDLMVEGLDFKYLITKPQKAPDGKSLNPLFTINKTVVKNSHIYFKNKPDYLLTDNFISYLDIVDLNNTTQLNTYSTSSIVLNNSAFLFQHKSENEVVKVVADTLTAIANNNTSLGIIVKDIALQNNSVVYNNISQPKKRAGLDYYHLDIQRLKLLASNTKFDNGNIKTNIQSFGFKDKSGFAIDTLSGLVNLDSSNVNIKDFYVETPYSKIAATALIYPESFKGGNKQKFPLPDNEIRLTKTIISRKDLELLAETLAKRYKNQLDVLGNLSIDGYVKGNVHKIYITSFVVNSLKNKDFRLDLTGDVANPSDIKKMFYNLNVKDISVSKELIVPFIPIETRRALSLQLPNRINVKGLVNGNMQNVNTDVIVNSAFGSAGIKAALKGFQNPKTMLYDVVLNAKNLETGKWIKRDTMLGLLNGQIAVKGSKGFDVKSNNMSVLAAIQSFRFNQNTINNIKTDLNLNSGIVSGKASIDDALIQIMFDGKANIQSEYASVNAVVNVLKADLLALGMTKDSIIVSAFTRLKVENSSPQNLNALIQIDSSVITRGAQTIALDSTRALAFVRNDTTFIDVVSPFMDAQLNSTVYYTQMSALAQQIINQFMPPAIAKDVLNDNKDAQNAQNTEGSNGTKNPQNAQNTEGSNGNKNPQNAQNTEGSITATILIKPNEAYSAFVKDLIFDKPIEINGNITTANVDSVVNIKLNVPSLTMGSLHVSPTRGTVLGRNDSLLVNIKTDTLQASNLLFYDARINGGFSKNQVNANILTHDINKKEQYALSVFAVPNNAKGYDISLGKDLLLNKIKWLVNEKNQVKTSHEGFNVQDFAINNEQQEIKANSETASANSPILVNISNFKLNTISAMLDQNTLSLDGLLNADLKVSDLKNTIPTLDGQIKIDSIIFQKTSIGNLEMLAKSEKGNVNIEGKLSGNGNEVNMTGVYAANSIDANIKLNPLTMTTIESFSQKNLKNSSGTIIGDIKITGEPSKPIWIGQLMFNNAQTIAAQFGTLIKIDNQTLRLKYPSIFFDKLTIQDGANNSLSINGSVSQIMPLLDGAKRTTKTNDFTTDLVIQSKGFRALNNTVADNNMLYGTALIDVDAQITGDVYAPNVTGNLVVKNGTEVTFMRQSTPPSAQERNGVIEFINRDTIDNLLNTKTLQDYLTAKQQAKKTSTLNFNLNLEVEKEAKFVIVVDPISGDELQVQGTAHINAGVNPNGSMGLVGTYDLSKGSYELSYQFIKRKFNLLEGSTIRLSGDPMKADVDITAAYDVKTPAIDLIKNEIGGSTAAGNEIYKRKSSFRVLLKVKGKVDKPEIAFDIILPEKAEGVTSEMATTINNKLDQLRADQSSMNKQVFAILILNKFIGEQSSDFFASNGGSNNLLSNESVSNFLNGAINQIVNDLIKGVDVDVNLKNVDDDPNAQRTDLNVVLGKNFLDDRLNISVGKSFTVDGTNPTSNTNNTNTQFIPDVNTTYKLSRDGRFMLRAYRKNQYEALLDGYFIETGVSFNFTIDYDKFREIFK
jgi:translocation and assembly module TamB